MSNIVMYSVALAVCLTEARFIGGICEGLLELMLRGEFLQTCGRNAGNAEAMVTCRQLGCNPVGAVRVNAFM